jgi:hypothetical protein
MQLGEECYAICDSISKGFFDNERCITLNGENRTELFVDIHCLGKTRDGYIAAKFHINGIKGGLASGIVYNCEDGAPSGFRIIPLDSLSPKEAITPFC